MHAIRGQALPSTFLEHPYEKNDSSKAHVGKKSKASPSSISTTPSPHDSETKGKDRGKDAAPNDSSSSSSSKKDKKKAKKAKKAKKDEIKGISSIVSASLMTTTAVLNHGGTAPKAVAAATVTASTALLPLPSTGPNRDRSGSTTSQRSNKSSHGATEDESQPINNSAPFALLPPILSIDDTSIPSINSVDGQGPQHHSSRLTSFLKRRKNSSSTTLSLDYTSLASNSSSSLQLPSSQSTHSQLQLHTITMVTQSDVHITWPHPVPSGNAYIAGTWSVPGHGPWEKLPMSRIPGTDSFEVHLDVQEIENVSEYVDEDGYINHDLLDSSSCPHDSTSTQPPASPSSTPTATLSKRQRISRFFGRARSLSSSSNSPSSSKDPQQELPYHHHCKDGIILPFTKQYCYQYKFVIDDEWKCDPLRAQVQDSQGHLNHELNVELIEQIHQPANRSRSSSLQSQHSITVSESTATTSVLLSEPLQPVQSQPEEQAKTEAETEIKTELAQEIPPITDVTPPVSAQRNRKLPTTTTKRRKAKDSYEAVLIFDETDDLSDGDGRQQYMSETESEAETDASHDDDDATPQQQQAQGVQPQQDEHAAPEEKGANNNNNNNNNNNVDVSAVATIAILSATAAEATEPTGQKDNQDEIAVETIVPRSIGPDATAPEERQEDGAVPLPIVDEVAPVPKEDFTPTISIEDVTIAPEQSAPLEDLATTVSIAVPQSTDVAVEDTPTAPVVDEAGPVVKEDSSQAAAIEAPQSVNVAVEQSSPAMKEEPKAFVLQEAANPEEYATNTQQDVSQQNPRPPSRAALEIVTDPNMTNKTNSTSYSQVPSPPLTPSSMYEAQGDTDLDDEDVSDADFDAEKYAALESMALLTPRPETTTPRLAPLMKEVMSEPVIAAVQPRGLVEEQLPKEEKVYQRTRSSAPTARHREKGVVEDEKKSKKEAVYERYPNLLWSLCKTTVVVSAAVVVLGIGLGRKRD